MKEASRQDVSSVQFLFWSNSVGEGEWVFDWWSGWHFVTSRDENPFIIQFSGDDIDNNFSTLLATENSDKFRPDAKTKIIIHGYTENGRIEWIKDMAHAYHDAGKKLILLIYLLVSPLLVLYDSLFFLRQLNFSTYFQTLVSML